MKRCRLNHIGLQAGMTALMLTLALAGTAQAQAVRTVEAQQSGPWSVGIDPASNTVRLASRKAFQARVIVGPAGEGFSSGSLAIPAGKRLVIENVSAIARSPEGLRMEINFFSYIDNNGDGVGDVSDIVFHRIALTDQGTFGGTAIASANHMVLVFADEQIGSGHFGVTVQARLNGSLPAGAFAQAQLTFSGYLEDLPAVP